MAEKYLGPAFDIHGGGVDLRFPHHENEQAQSRAAGHPFASYWMHNAWITTAGREDVEVARQLPADPERAGAGARDRAAVLHGRGPLPLARRVLLRGARRGGRRRSAGSRASSSGQPARRLAAVDPVSCRRSRGHGRRPRHAGRGRGAARHGAARATALLADRARGAARQPRERPAAMLDVLGLHPADPAWPSGGGSRRAADPGGRRPRRQACCEQRAEARAAKDFATADAIRDRIKAAGIEIEDTPTGPTWSLAGSDDDVAGNSQAQGRVPQVQRKGKPHGRAPAVGSGAGSRARARRPKAKDRPYHKALQAAGRSRRRPRATRARQRPRAAATPSGWPAATPWSRRSARGSR